MSGIFCCGHEVRRPTCDQDCRIDSPDKLKGIAWMVSGVALILIFTILLILTATHTLPATLKYFNMSASSLYTFRMVAFSAALAIGFISLSAGTYKFFTATPTSPRI